MCLYTTRTVVPRILCPWLVPRHRGRTCTRKLPTCYPPRPLVAVNESPLLLENRLQEPTLAPFLTPGCATPGLQDLVGDKEPNCLQGVRCLSLPSASLQTAAWAGSGISVSLILGQSAKPTGTYEVPTTSYSHCPALPSMLHPCQMHALNGVAGHLRSARVTVRSVLANTQTP